MFNAKFGIQLIKLKKIILSSKLNSMSVFRGGCFPGVGRRHAAEQVRLALLGTVLLVFVDTGLHQLDVGSRAAVLGKPVDDRAQLARGLETYKPLQMGRLGGWGNLPAKIDALHAILAALPSFQIFYLIFRVVVQREREPSPARVQVHLYFYVVGPGVCGGGVFYECAKKTVLHIRIFEDTKMLLLLGNTMGGGS